MATSRYQRKYSYSILTPEGPVASGEAVSAVFPAVDGEVGILGGRAPLVATIGSGPMTVSHPDGTSRQWFVAGGFVQVRPEAMTVLAEQAVAMDQLDLKAAVDELEQARKMPVDSPAALEARSQAVYAASRKYALAKRHKH
jgi:F-type H+-transporting ATPase subunit epsilon